MEHVRKPGVVRGFQSLFSWMLLCDYLTASDRSCSHRSFNPCFRGCCSVTGDAIVRVTNNTKFQSLFSWMLLCDHRNTEEARCDVEFQSLFSWMLLCDSSCAFGSSSASRGFNPCFRGCCSVTLSYQTVTSCPHRVSILVFVDVAL